MEYRGRAATTGGTAIVGLRGATRDIGAVCGRDSAASRGAATSTNAGRWGRGTGESRRLSEVTTTRNGRRRSSEEVTQLAELEQRRSDDRLEIRYETRERDTGAALQVHRDDGGAGFGGPGHEAAFG